MRRFLVTGASGLVGLRALRQLLAAGDDVQVVAVDRDRLPEATARLDPRRLDLLRSPLEPLLADVDVIVHLAEAEPSRSYGPMLELTDRVLSSAVDAGIGHVVLLSSAMAYGAYPDNPVPLTEAAPLRPEPELPFAVGKAEEERLGLAWRDGAPGRTLSVLRPTTALSEQGASWVARTLRAATAVRPDQVDPPVQFLHVADLAAAVTLAARRHLDGPFNVAPDRWLGPERLQALDAHPHLRLPDPLNEALVRARSRIGIRPVPPGILPYVRYPWVVANDRLRSQGWVPAFSNEEAYIAGTPAPPWAAVSPKRRQELALGLTGAAAVGLAGAAFGVARRITR